MFGYRTAHIDRINLSCEAITVNMATSPPPTRNHYAVSGTRIPIWTVILALLLLMSATARAGDKPFDMSANWGGTGLMEIPTARILPDGAMRLGTAMASPYIWYTFGFGVLPGLEFTSRYTDITNIPSGLGSDFGSFKDKAFDIKYQLLPESKRGPAIALGWNDFQGTRQFEAQYLVISRQLYPLDITLGVGRQRLKGPISINDEIGFWGGVEWAVTDRLHLMLEYNPIEYDQDTLPSRGVSDGSASPFNAGLRYRTWLGFDLGLSFQRGDTLALAAHFQFGLGRPILPHKPDPPSWRFAMQPATVPNAHNQRTQRLSAAIEQAGFTDIATTNTDDELIAEFENNRYLSHATAAGRVLRLLLLHAGSDTRYLTVVLKSKGLKILYVSISTENARSYLMGDMTDDHFARRLMVVAQNRHKSRAPSAANIGAAARHHSASETLSYGIDPVLESFFNDPSGVYQSRISLRPWATLSLWPGAALHGSYDFPLLADIESASSPLPDAVRSDSWKYLGSESAVNRLLFDQIIKLAPLTYARFSAGYLERMYAGAGGEVLTFMDQGRWALGLEGDWVRKREPDEAWNLTDQENHTLLTNLYYRYFPLDITLKAQAGRFLAGDTGLRMEFRRRFDTGSEIGFWYSITDTAQLTDFNEGYNDQGIYLKIPFSVFTVRPTRRMLQYQISPWTRDVGATIDHWQDVYDTITDLSPSYFRRDLDRLKE